MNRPQEIVVNRDVNVAAAAIEKALKQRSVFRARGNAYRALEVIGDWNAGSNR